jgi:DNA modification methylase
MKPTIETDQYTLYLADCMDVLPTLEGVDAVVADPPYGIGYKPQGHATSGSKALRSFSPADQLIGDTGKLDFDPRPWLELGGKQVWWGANYYANKLPNAKGWLCWFKARGMESTNFSAAEMAWTTLPNAVRALDFRWMGVIRDADNSSPSLHPTQKPIQVMRWCIELCDLPPNSLILDPFMGSGTTGVAAIELGHRFIGIEIDPEYFETAHKRIKHAASQRRMFA